MRQLAFLILYLFINTPILAQETDFKKLFNEHQYEKIIEILHKKEQNKPLSVTEYKFLTRSYGRLEQYSNGLFYANKMIALYTKEKDTVGLLTAYNLKAENLIDMGFIDKGIAFCEKVAPTFEGQDSTYFQSFCFKWGIFYKVNEDYEKAKEIYDKITLEKFRKLSLFKNNYAVILEGLKDYDKALENMKKATSDNYKNNEDVVLSLSNIANIYMKKGEWSQAKIYLDSADNAINKKTPLRSKKALYEKYYDYSIRENLLEASVYLSLIKDLNQQIFEKKLNEEVEIAKNSIAKEAALNEALARSQKEKLIGAIVLLVIILVLLSILYFLKFRNIKVAHEAVVTEQRLLRSQMTPHFIFNSLSVLQGMILNKEDTKAIRYLSKFSKLLRLILENSREKLVPLEEELSAIQNYVDLHNMRSESKFEYKLHLRGLDDIDIFVPPMLIQPFVENAIQHGFNKNYKDAVISVSLTLKDNKLLCIIQDNGKGLNTNKQVNKDKKSLSTAITSERLKLFAKEYNVVCKLIVEDRSKYNEQGTQVKLLMPYKIEKDA